MTVPISRNITIGIVFHNEASRIPLFFSKLALAVPTGVWPIILGFDNASTDESADFFRRQCKELDWESNISKSSINNMGAARDWILRNATTEFVYFLDVDVSPSTSSIASLMSQLEIHRKDENICAATGPMNVASSNPFQSRLVLLQKSWLGNFGSAQMKNSFKNKTLSHAPTAHLMIKKIEYLNAGSFNTSLDRSGEDLEMHWRLSSLNRKILWIDEASAEHDIASNLDQWLKKCFKYGIAQTQVAKIHPKFFLTQKCLPLWIFIFAIICMNVSPIVFCLLAVGYFLSIGTAAIMLSFRSAIPLFGLLFMTHIFYLLGEIFGLVRIADNSTSKR